MEIPHMSYRLALGSEVRDVLTPIIVADAQTVNKKLLIRRVPRACCYNATPGTPAFRIVNTVHEAATAAKSSNNFLVDAFSKPL